VLAIRNVSQLPFCLYTQLVPTLAMLQSLLFPRIFTPIDQITDH